MIVTYTFPGFGISVTLTHIATRGIMRKAVNSDDDTTYLYTLCTLDLTARLGPGATSYTTGPLPVSNNRPALTDRAIRHLMMQHRGVLTIFAEDGNLLVQCPPSGYDVDAAGGPKTRAFDILEVQGSELFLVHWVVEFAVNECGNGNVILSYRYTMQESFDKHGLSTRTVDSTTDFNVAEIFRQGIIPDMLRPLLVHLPPLGFKREDLRIWHAPDWTQLKIVSVDRQLPKSWGKGVTDVECLMTRWSMQPGWDMNNVASVLETSMNGGFAGAIAGAISGVSVAPGTGAAGVGPGWAWGALTAFTGAMFREGLRSLPQHYVSVIVRVWGGPESALWDLENFAMQTAVAAFSKADPAFKTRALFRPCVEAMMTTDEAGKFAEFRYTVRYGPGAAQSFGYFLQLGKKRPNPKEYETLKSKDGKLLITPDPQPIQGAANGLGTRSTYLMALVANTLQAPCKAPFSPDNYIYALNAIPQQTRYMTPPSQSAGSAGQDPGASNPGSQNPSS